ncbi:MAG TPA: isoamylase early set domain-containing protein [Gemmatimonadaceae bacterium]|nr:isoamylase early set domain-containing protein [Gemmatimonadaceae bacterium]
MDPREQELIDRIASELRSGVRFDASFDRRVMAEVRRSGTPIRLSMVRSARRPGGDSWLLRPRSFQITPLTGLAAAAAFAAIVVAGSVALRPQGEMPGTAPVVAAVADTPAVQVVRFVLQAPAASHVSLVGDFNEWNPAATPLEVVASEGVWTVSVSLPLGRHVYAFVVDGAEWVPDPAAPKALGDDFGVPNSVITVGGSAS